MQAHCDKAKLSEALQEIIAVVPSSSMIPVLNNILLNVNKDKLVLTASDLEIGLTIIIECESEDELKTTVPAKLFAEIIKNFPEERITLDFQTDSVKILGQKSQFFVNCVEPTEFPLLPEVSGKAFTLKKDITLNLYNRVLPAVSSRGEGNIAFSSILLETSANEFRLITTDGQRLIVSKYWDSADFNSLHILVPPKTFAVLNKILLKEKNDIEFTVGDREISFVMDGKKLISRILEGNFPDYNKVIPENNSFSFLAYKSEIINALQRIHIVVRDSNRRVVFKLSQNNLQLSGNDPEKGWAEESLTVESIGGEFEGMFDVKKLIDGINNVETEKVVFETAGPLHPLVIKEHDSDKYIYVLVSLRSL